MREKMVTIRMTPVEKNLLARAANRHGLDMSSYVRLVARRDARKEIDLLAESEGPTEEQINDANNGSGEHRTAVSIIKECE